MQTPNKKAARKGLLNGEVKNVQGELQAQKNWRKKSARIRSNTTPVY